MKPYRSDGRQRRRRARKDQNYRVEKVVRERQARQERRRKTKGRGKQLPSPEMVKAQKWIDNILANGRFTDSDQFPRAANS